MAADPPRKTPHGRGSIVCVGRERNVRELLADQLREIFGHSHDVVSAASAEEALGAAFKIHKEDRVLDLVISDTQLSGMQGDRFLEIVHGRFLGVKKILLVSGAGDTDSILYALNNAKLDKYITKPWTRDDLSFVVEALLKELRLSRANEKLLHDIQRKNRELEAALQRVREAQRELERGYQHTLQSLALALEAKDRYTAGHSERVCRFAVLLARELGLPDDEVEVVRSAALLHDIGKIGMPEKVLRKEGGLTAAEFSQMQEHPATGAQILSPVRSFSRCLSGVRHHHERYDGLGYPDGLKGEEIPISARIILIADTFDSITSDRSYRKARTVEYAVRQLQGNAGSQFDPRCVEAFVRLLSDKKIYAGPQEPLAAVPALPLQRG
jgi:putative nucleotidyltransferase with HDIG domain